MSVTAKLYFDIYLPPDDGLERHLLSAFIFSASAYGVRR
jgi:hypothetical protein